jgi:hypothetical protein
MSAMVPIALSIVLSTLVGSYVGFRTLAIARRTRKLPELAVGTGLVAYAAVSQVALITLLVLGETAPPSVRTGLLVTRVAALHTSLLALSVFTWHTFGKSSRWRQSLAAIVGVVATLGCCVIAAGFLGLDGRSGPSDTWATSLDACFAVTFGWMGAESLRYCARMRRRRALGLADPLVTNRLLLWGLGAAASSLCVGALVAFAIFAERPPRDSVLVAVLVTLPGLVNSVVWWLSFVPPAAYVRWVRSAHSGPTHG